MKVVWKIYKILAVTVVTVLVIDLAAVMFFSFYRPQIQKADAIVILGAAINTPALYNRSLEGLRLYEAGKANTIVVSGGQDFSGAQTESAYMQEVLEANSRQPVPIILEDQSHSTYDNIKNTKQKLGGQAGSLIIVSDDFHLARAVLIAKRLGFGPVYWSSPKPVYYKNFELAYYYFREVFAMLDYLPKFVFG
jgi:uncharacterized SAM-binding protein YcdF (DUF218 family)